MTSIIKKQLEEQISMWGNNMEKFYPQYSEHWKNPSSHVKALNEEWNYFNAVKIIDWETFLYKDNMVILDLGCGTGWLSAYLSKFKKVKKIIALDADLYNLESMLPEVTQKLNGDRSKITPVHGLFEPLPFENNSFDLIVSSSAFHHASDITSLFLEMKRLISSEGYIMVLNEVPVNKLFYIAKLTKYFLNSVFINLIDRYKLPTIKSSPVGILYDPFLGDIMYSLGQWDSIINSCGLSYSLHNSSLKPNIKTKSYFYLKHFICRKQV